MEQNEQQEPTIEQYQQENHLLRMVIQGLKADIGNMAEQKSIQATLYAQSQAAVQELSKQVQSFGNEIQEDKKTIQDLADKLKIVEEKLVGDSDANPDN